MTPNATATEAVACTELAAAVKSAFTGKCLFTSVCTVSAVQRKCEIRRGNEKKFLLLGMQVDKSLWKTSLSTSTPAAIAESKQALEVPYSIVAPALDH